MLPPVREIGKSAAQVHQLSPPGVERQPIDGCGSRHRKEVSEGDGPAVRAEGSEGLIDVALSGFEGILEEGGK